jgi:peptidoglycan hydrolase-like protein with peptidoglycan-binding domain
MDQLIAANQNHPNIKNRTPDDPQYGWLEIGDVINIPRGAPGIPAPSASLPSTPPSPGTTPSGPPTLDLPATVRVLQAHLNLTVASIPVTGTFDAATGKALQLWQLSKGLLPSGVVDPATVEALLTDMVATDQHEFAIQLVADAEDLNTSDVVALRTAWTWDPAWGQGDAHVEWEGSLREIWVRKDAFTTRARLVAALQQGLAAVPALGPAGPVPAILAPADEAAAITQVSSRLGEPIAIAALRDIVGASLGTAVDAELVQRLADWQGPGLATGRLDDASLDRIVRTERSGRENSVIRLVMDAFDLGSNALVSVLFEEDYLRNKSIDAVTIEFSGSVGSGARPSIVYLGPRVFGSLAVLLQNIMHELVHVELSAQGTLQGKRGTPERALHEFLGEATEILAAPRVSVYDTVIMDGTRALTDWQVMSPADRATHWSTFEDVRTAVLQAIATVPAGDQDYAKYQKVKTDYCAVLPNNSVGAFCSPPAPNPKRGRK